MLKTQLPTRQRIRKALVLLTFLSFPITMNFLSPYVIIDGAMNGIINGSLVMFGLMFISSLFLGRAWCGWVCPGGGMGEMAESINSRPVKPSKIGWIKWLIWIPWITLIFVMADTKPSICFTTPKMGFRWPGRLSARFSSPISFTTL